MSAPAIHWQELDALELAEALLNLAQSGAEACTDFVDLHQYAALLDDPRFVCWGGHAAAQFRRIGLGFPPVLAIWSLSAVSQPQQVKGARQLRNQLQRFGLPPASLGDIDWNARVLAALPGLSLASLLPGAVQLETWPSAPPVEQRVTAAALRLDAVLASIFHVSREEAKTAIEYGFVFVNFRATGKATLQIKPGDQIVYRSKGRAQILAAGLNVRSHRHTLEYAFFQC